MIEAGEAGTLRERHVDYFIAVVDAYGEHGLRQDYYAWRDGLAMEADNLRAVMDWVADDRHRMLSKGELLSLDEAAAFALV